jgi:hypothetical protein
MTKQQIIEILKQLDIPCTPGPAKNVAPDAIGIKCPYCDDHSNHLGIFEGDGNFSCWRCRTKGPLIYLIRKLTGWSEDKCKELIGYDSSFKDDESSDVTNRQSNQFLGLPKLFEKVTTDTDFQLFHEYMERRHIQISTIIKNGCGICRAGRYMNRLIIPVIFNGKIVSFQAADLTGSARLKYDTAPGDINQYLYNYDSIKTNGKMILTEGILDTWRAGNDAVCSFGTHLTDRQRQLILDKKPSELVFLWDEDAYFKISPYNSDAGWFLPFIDRIKIVRLLEGEDPDSYGIRYGISSLFELIDGTELWSG